MKPIKNALKELPKTAQNGNQQQQENNLPDAKQLADAIKTAIKKDQKNKALKFPLKAFPKAIQDIVRCWHDCYLLPVDFYAGAILAAASAAIGNYHHIQYKLHHVEPPICWMVIVGAPGVGKTPAIKFAMNPLFRQEKQFSKDHKAAVAQWEQDKQDAAKAKAKNYSQARPVRSQGVINDATIESLIKILPHNPKGLICYRDEFIGLMKSMNAYKSSGGDLEHWLSIWSGSPIILNRSSLEDAVFIESPFVPIIGGIQPGILIKLTDRNQVDNGYLHRLLFAFPETQDIPPDTNVTPDQSVFDHYREIIKRLGMFPKKDDNTPFVTELSKDAFKTFREHKIKTEKDCNSLDDDNIKSLYIKQLSYTLRFSLILEFLEIAATADDGFIKALSLKDLLKMKVSRQSMLKAIKLSEYFTSTSMKVIARSESPIAALPKRQQLLYDKLPTIITSSFAKSVGEKIGMSESTVKRLIYNRSIFKQTPDGAYRKLYT
ncbi:MAG TPA: DUF3987 domain-containing protein [Bacteroidetes bacterium]|nr:DUF3987 domain-containing protein [Bacteroidota bacterium]